MSFTLLQIANMAGGKIGGFGDQLGGDAFLPGLAGTDEVTLWVNATYPKVRQKVISDLASIQCPFRETLKYADLGDDLKQNDNAIASIVVGTTPFVVTVTTSEAHGYTTGDTVMLFHVQGTGGITSLNNKLYTITVTSTTAFTLDTIVGDAGWIHTADTGISSDCPEMGNWRYAFDLPNDFFCIVRQTDKNHCTYFWFDEGNRAYRECKFQTIINKDGDGFLFLTNHLSNREHTSAFIEYCIDQTNPALFSQAFVECLVTLLAAELCPIVGKDIKTRQQMLLEYEQLSKPDAQAYNQTQFNNEAHVVSDYKGGRT